MTQPEQAVEGTEETVLLDEPTIEDRFANLANEIEPEEEPEEEDAEQDEQQLAADDAEENEETEAEETGLAPPISWTDEEKAEFATLPPSVQKTISRRETEREKFVQSKSQEARQAALEANRQAADQLGQLQVRYAQQLASLVPQVPEKPSAHLMATDPQAYAARLDAHERGVAQYNNIAQQMNQVVSQFDAVQQQQAQQDAIEFRETLAAQFPEFIAPDSGPELQKNLGSTAALLGYSSEEIASATPKDVLAMRRANEWRTKAEKYDALQADKMGKVRAAKLPSVSRPGAAPPKGAAANARYTADRKAMRTGDKDAAARVFGRFI